MKPDFSEFSYGYAVTEELVAKNNVSVIAAPSFPSLYDEGKAGGGYDVMIPIVGTPVFLQFKLSDRLQRTNAKEFKSGLLSLPYFRMHIRPNKHSDQHNLLLALEAKGEAVFYIAPEFSQPEELNEFYLRRTVVANSAAFSPATIGPMPDDHDHYVAYERGSRVGYRCSSQPVQVGKFDLDKGLGSLLETRGVKSRAVGDEALREISRRMLEALAESPGRLGTKRRKVGIDGVRRIVEERKPIESAGYIARTFFDCELLVLAG